MGAHDVRLERREIDLDHAVIVAVGIGQRVSIGGQEVGVLVGERGKRRAVGGYKVRGDARVVREERRRGAELRTHVANGRLAGGAERRAAGAEVL